LAHVVRTVRVTIEENGAINGAAAALDSQRATLIQEAVAEAAHKLGLYAGIDLPVRPRRPSWSDAPERRDESATERFAVSYSPQLYALLQRAAKLVGISETLFAVGATLRYIAALKKAQPRNAGLRAVRLPRKFAG